LPLAARPVAIKVIGRDLDVITIFLDAVRLLLNAWQPSFS